MQLIFPAILLELFDFSKEENIMVFFENLKWDLQTAILVFKNRSLIKILARRGYRLAHKSPYELNFVRGKETKSWRECADGFFDIAEIPFYKIARKLHVDGTFMGVQFFHDGDQIVGRGVDFYFG